MTIKDIIKVNRTIDKLKTLSNDELEILEYCRKLDYQKEKDWTFVYNTNITGEFKNLFIECQKNIYELNNIFTKMRIIKNKFKEHFKEDI